MRRHGLGLVLVLVLLVSCTSAAAPRSRSIPSGRPSSTNPVPSPSPSSRRLPRWGIAPLSGETLRWVRERNWHPGCPVALEDLRTVTVRYHGFDGRIRAGPLVLNARVAADVLWVFRRLFRHGFPIRHVGLARAWHPTRPSDWNDTHDVTASFNCRPVTGGTTLSQHSFGWAVDINPLQNPYVRGDGTVLRRAARRYVDRSQQLPGMIHAGDVVVRSFARIGWGWGGDWQTLKDTMHFSLTGR